MGSPSGCWVSGTVWFMKLVPVPADGARLRLLEVRLSNNEERRLRRGLAMPRIDLALLVAPVAAVTLEEADEDRRKSLLPGDMIADSNGKAPCASEVLADAAAISFRGRLIPALEGGDAKSVECLEGDRPKSASEKSRRDVICC